MLRLPPQTYNTTTAIWLLVNATATPADLQHYYCYLENILTIPSPVRDSSSWFLKTSPQSLDTASTSTSYILDILSASSRNPSAWFPNQPSTNPDTRSYCWEVSKLPTPESTQSCMLTLSLATNMKTSLANRSQDPHSDSLEPYRWSSNPGFPTSF